MPTIANARRENQRPSSVKIHRDPPEIVRMGQGYIEDDDGDLLGPYGVDRDGRYPCSEVEYAALLARACADEAATFDRFHWLLNWNHGLYDLDEWLAATSRAELRTIWAAPLYRNPRHWGTTVSRDTCTLDRWAHLCAPLRACDAIWHQIPDGLEDAYCEVLDWLRWDYRRTAMRAREPQPKTPKLNAMSRRQRDAVFDGAMKLRDRWTDWKGTPWRIVAHARRASFAAWEREWPQRRAGEPLTFKPPSPLGGLRSTSLASLKRRRK